MAKRVFFSFHYDDIWRVSRVRNHWITKPDRQTAGFWDAAEWEKIKLGGDAKIKNWIDTQLNGCSTTVVLIGAETANRKYVKYEIEKSYELGKRIIGIQIHKMKNQYGQTSSKGLNPFSLYKDSSTGKNLSEIIPVYDWVLDDGYNNFSSWIG